MIAPKITSLAVTFVLFVAVVTARAGEADLVLPMAGLAHATEVVERPASISRAKVPLVEAILIAVPNHADCGWRRCKLTVVFG